MCETEENINCDYPDCTLKAKYEIYWGDRPYSEMLKEIKSGSVVEWEKL